MAEDKRWWKRDEDSDSSKEDVEDMLNEAEAKRLQREEEVAEAEHREKMSKFSKTESQEGDHGSTEEFDGQRIVLKPDRHGNFFVKGSIGNIANINFLVDTGASFCSVKDETAKMLDLDWGEKNRDINSSWQRDGFQNDFARRNNWTDFNKKR